MHTTLQVARHAYELADHRFADGTSRFPTAEEVMQYCNGYADSWKLWPNIRLNSDVLSVSRSASLDCAATFAVQYQNSTTNEASTEFFTHVVLATGLCSNQPNIPPFEGAEKFSGILIHSSERRDDAKELAHKDVVVVGSGKSALDACMAAVDAGAKNVTQVVRTTHWAIPFDLFGCFPCASA
jgi:cation diffusion facilitator CzcD-associated flavoprotein CzcO